MGENWVTDRSALVSRVDYIETEDWETIVRNMPIPSVDLLVRCPDGILLGRRTNDPAKGEWFVPGGRVQKGEQLTDAVHRIAREELGLDVTIEESLGSFDHFYEISDISDAIGKHYIAHGYLVTTNTCEANGDRQHSSFRVFSSLPEDLHPHILAYLRKVDRDLIPHS